jgi:hypothetical protein
MSVAAKSAASGALQRGPTFQPTMALSKTRDLKFETLSRKTLMGSRDLAKNTPKTPTPKRPPVSRWLGRGAMAAQIIQVARVLAPRLRTVRESIHFVACSQEHDHDDELYSMSGSVHAPLRALHGVRFLAPSQH